MSVSEKDFNTISQQLGRPPREVESVAYYTPTGVPGVIITHPRLKNGEPFPTLYYLTEECLVSEISKLESTGIMKVLTEWLSSNPAVRQQYHRAHESYLQERNLREDLGIDFSGGGMPDRVKCLHFLVAHSLASGAGLNPVGDICVAYLADNIALRGSVIPADWPSLSCEDAQLFHLISLEAR